MSFYIRDNNGNPFGVGDINQVKSSSGAIYWSGGKSSQLIPKDIYDYMVEAGYSEPSINFNNDTLALVKNLDYQTITDLNNQYLWYVGDCQRGGLAFSISDNNIYLTRVKLTDLAETGFDWAIKNRLRQVVTIGQSTAKAVLYFCHRHIVNGNPLPSSAFGLYVINTPNYGFTVYSGYSQDVLGDYYLLFNSVYHLNDVALYEGNDFSLFLPLRTYGYLDSQTTGGTVPYINWWDGLDIFVEDPMAPGGISEPAGGDGGFDNTSDDIPIPELPPDMLLNSGIVKMYAPTAQNMNDFLNYLYAAPDQIITNIKKLWVNPFDSIISFGTIPFAVSAPTSEVVKFCGVSTGVSMPILASQFQQIDCGSFIFGKYWNGALDHNSYTKIKLFLPFIGFVPMNTDELIGGTITIKYNCDLFTGDCMAFVHVQKNDLFDINYNGCIYAFKGNVFTQAPLSGSDYTGMYGSILNAVGHIANPSVASVAGIAKEVLGQKVEVQHSNGMSANAGTLGEYTPYFIIERPIQSLPANYPKFKGYPCNINYILKTLHGYTEVETGTFYTNSIDYITDEEAQELVDMLDKGVVLP